MNGYDITFEVMPDGELIEMLIADLITTETVRVFLTSEDAYTFISDLELCISALPMGRHINNDD